MKELKEILKFISELIVDFLACVAIVLITCTFIVCPMTISQNSMYPTLHDGDFGFNNIIKMKLFGIDRFDIVVINNDGKKLIKRVIGLPNETVTYINDRLYINGEYIEEDFLDEEYKSQYSTFTESFEVTLKDNEYYCLGDNRPVSADSRCYGPFKYDQIKSVDAIILYPFENMGVY